MVEMLLDFVWLLLSLWRQHMGTHYFGCICKVLQDFFDPEHLVFVFGCRHRLNVTSTAGSCSPYHQVIPSYKKKGEVALVECKAMDID